MIHYGMTKTAQVAVARGLAESVAGTGVTVNSVLAGPTASEGAGNFVANMAKQQNISEAEVEKQFFETIRPTSLRLDGRPGPHRRRHRRLPKLEAFAASLAAPR
jgi:NAD(P)-dependent dehydrogenase (short-subunit alcohol dehydrogenase family)